MPSFFTDPTADLTPEEFARAEEGFKQRFPDFQPDKGGFPATNGSTGPKTAEGKAASSRNAFKHGFSASSPLISSDNAEDWNHHLQAYFDRFRPTDQVESDCVRAIATAVWQRDRIDSAEAALWNLEMEYYLPLCDAKLGPLTEPQRLAVALKESHGSDGALELIRRYRNDVIRHYERHLRLYDKLKSDRPKSPEPAKTPEKAPTRNELPSEPQKTASNVHTQPTQAPKPENPTSREAEKDLLTRK
jgi:hypothetical protein